MRALVSIAARSRERRRRAAIAGLLLPYAVNLLLTLFFRSIVGHAGETGTPEERALYGKVVLVATGAALALSALLPLPYAVARIREKTGAIADPAARRARRGALAAAYGAIVAVNGALVVLLQMIVEMLVAGAR